MPIFQDANGLAVKFFIQKDLSQEIQAELCETITSLGGRVETKVPRQGYILIQPGTTEEERLRLCWTSPDRPDRHFVPYTYVEACSMAGMLLKQIFVENGMPIRMHIHPSIANPNVRSVLSQRIMHSGGDPTASLQSARVILADPNTEVFQHLVKSYQGVPDKYIESFLWVKKCVEKGALVYTPMVYKNPGGRRPGEERTQFTPEDEEHLCNWIATKIPFKETGGRTGNRLYQQLVDLSSDPEYAWVTRHTWQSWRERYKKNSARLDITIQAIVDQKKPIHGEKGQYGYVRAEEKPKRRKRRPKFEEASSSAGEGALLAENEDQLVRLASMLMPGLQGEPGPSQLNPMLMPDANLPASLPIIPSMLTSPAGVPLDQAAVRKSPAEEEDTEDGDEWAIRVGNAPPPPWGKRKVTEDPENENSNKRHKNGETSTAAKPPSVELDGNHELDAQTLVTIANMHMIDQAIRDIALEYRFTVEEVKEYYDKHGDIARVRARFLGMRDALQAQFKEE